MLPNQKSEAIYSLRALEWLAERPKVTIWTVAFVAFAGCVGYALVNGIAQPAVADEFSYLLAGDTFVSGRLSNPAHPMWQHFEAFHVIQQPTYASKYPPGQGVVLALGQILGHPILGVWLSVALMAAAISWMLYQWVPPRWAALGSLLSIVQLGFPTYWAQSYWGGALAALGGALLFGALRAGATIPRLRYGLLLGLGIMVLANTRPLEGALAAAPAAVCLIWLIGRAEKEQRGRLLRVVVAPAAVLTAVTVCMIAIYNRAVTGDVTRLPHREYSEQYHMGALFPWQEPSPMVDYRHEELRRFKQEWSIGRHEQQREHWIGALVFKFLRLEVFFFGPGVLALLMIPFLLRDRWVLLASASGSLVVLSTSLTLSSFPHYAAPVAALLIALILQGLRRLSAVRFDALDGRRVVTLILLAYLPYLVLRYPHISGAAVLESGHRRQQVLESLEARDGNDLVIVRYGHDHNYHLEWVYNRAVIDSAPVVWARSMSPAENQELIRYFQGRWVWLLEVNGGAHLRSYTVRPTDGGEPSLSRERTLPGSHPSPSRAQDHRRVP